MLRQSPNRLVVIAASARTGSTLLLSGLHACGVATTSREALNPFRIAAHLTGLSRIRYLIGHPYSAVEKASTRSVRNALRNIAAESTSSDGTLVLKVMWNHLHSILHSRGLDLDAFGAPITWIRIRRIDQVQQAVSRERAKQTGSWRSSVQEVRLPTFDAGRIAQALDFLRQEEAGWDTYLAALGATPLQVTYEGLDADYEGEMRRVLDYIGSPNVTVPPRQISRQADHLNAEWVERFLSTHPDSKGD